MKGNTKNLRRNKRRDNVKEGNSNYEGTKEGFVTNDPTWYLQYPELADSAGTYRFSTPVGMPINIFSDNTSATSITVPGIMTLETHICPGLAVDASSPINVQAKQLYTYMRAKRSGSSSYDPSDIMTYLLAMDSAYCFYFHYKRLLGCVNRSDARNRYTPEALVASMNGNYSDLLKNSANLANYLQSYVARLASYFVPANMTYLARHSTLFSNVYYDKMSPKAQMYVYNPSGYYEYKEVASSAGPASLTWKRSQPGTFSTIVALGESLLAPLMASQDINQMSTDIYNTFGDSCYTVTNVPMGYTVEPVYDLEMLNQIQNATITGQDKGTDITQDVDKGIIVFDPTLYAPSGTQIDTMVHNRLLCVEKDYTDVPRIMTSTRLLSLLKKDAAGTSLKLASCGSEFIEQMLVFIHSWDGYGMMSTNHLSLDRSDYCLTATSTKVDISDLHDYMEVLSVVNTFDYHPAIYSWLGSGTGAYNFKALALNYDYVTVIDSKELDKLHYAAMLSEFYVPRPQ